MIPISVVDVRDAEPLVVEVLRSGMIAQGPMVARLERSIGELIGVGHVVAVNNGTTALVAALQALDLQPGDEVITSPFTFVATLNAILDAGATVRFADITEVDFAVDPAAVEAAVGPRSAVLMPVHLYGQTADMERLLPIVAGKGLRLIEDAAQALGASQGGRLAGSFGIGAFSFYATKNVTSGEGGVITTDDDALADRLRVMRNQGMRDRYQYEMVGHNYRLTDLQAALAIPQVERYQDIVTCRQDNAAALSAGLADIDGLRLPAEVPGRRHVWHQYTILVQPDFALSRDDIVAALLARGVGAGVYYPRPVYDYECYRNHPMVTLDAMPVAESVASRCLSLPVHQHLSPADLEQIVDAMHAVTTR